MDTNLSYGVSTMPDTTGEAKEGGVSSPTSLPPKPSRKRHMTDDQTNDPGIIPTGSSGIGITDGIEGGHRKLANRNGSKSPVGQEPFSNHEMTVDEDLGAPRKFGFVDIKKLEHSSRMLQKNIKLIIDEAPNVKQINDLIKSQALDSLTMDNLQNNKLVHLASQLKTLYELNNLKVFDLILDNTINPKDTGEIHNLERDNEFVSDQESLNDTKPGDNPEEDHEVVYKTSNDSHDEYEFLQAIDQNTIKATEPEIVKRDNEEEILETVNENYPDLPLIKDPHLYSRVFIHKSTINNKSYLYQSELITSHNERLEFLGDSVLNNVATIILYNRYPTAPEGELSKMRSMLVNNVTLAEFSINYGFDKKLKSNINDVILRQGKQKIFADLFEAYVGALAMENDLEFGIIKDWLFKLFLNRLNQFDHDIQETEEVNKDAKLELYSLVGTAAFHPTYKVLKTGDGASKPFKVDCVMGDEILGTGIAPGLKEAGLRAAMVALRNKPLLEKYIQLRLNTDRNQSTVSHKNPTEPTHFLAGSNNNTFSLPLEGTNSKLPLVANDDISFDSDARNRLYAILSKNFSIFPEYNCQELDNKLFSAELKVNNIPLAFATDISKKKAMAKAAKLVLDNPNVLASLNT